MSPFCRMPSLSYCILAVACSLLGGGSEFALGQSGEPSRTAPKNVGEATPRSSNKLDAPARALNPPEGTLGSAVAEKPIVVIYYANESAPDAAESDRVRTLTQWLRDTGNAEIAASADGIENDLRDFPQAVDADIAALKQGHAATTRNRPAVVIFTNRLAHEGKLETAPADRPGEFKQVAFVIPVERRGLYQAYPLSAREVFAAALRRTAELYPPVTHEYVLITKSHGATNLALTPKYQSGVAPASRESFMEKTQANFARQLAAKLKTANSLYIAPGKKLLDDQRRAVVEQDGVLYWERVGKLQILSDSKAIYLADRGGKPFLSADGKRLVIVGKSLRLEGSNANVLDSQDKGIELLAVPGRNLDHHPEVGAPLASSRRPMWFPLLRSPLLANAIQTDKLLKIPVPEGGIIGIPVRKHLIDKAQTIPTGDETWLIHQAQFNRTAEQLQVPLLDADELVAPLVSVGRKAFPLLAVNKWIGDSRLGPMTDGTLDPDNNDTLDPDSNDTLDPDSNDTLDPDSNDTLDPDSNDTLGITETSSSPKKAKRYGTSKTQYVAALERQGKTVNMYFRLVFLESCQSQLSNDLLKRLRTRGTTQIGQVWSSDARGLQYSTCDYGRAFGALKNANSFSEALSHTLENQFADEQRARDELLK